MGHIDFTDFSAELLPLTKEDSKCLQKKMIKMRNRDLLKRILTEMQEKPYEYYKFEVNKQLR